MKQVGGTKFLWRFLIALILVAFLVPISASPVAAINISDYFEISYEPVGFVDTNGNPKTQIYVDEIFYAKIQGSANCTKDLPSPYNKVSEVRTTSRIIAKHKVNGSKQTLNSSYTITIKPFPKKKGDTTQIGKDIPVQFPEGSHAGDYNVMGELIKAEAKTFLGWQNITSYLPSSQAMGSVTYIAPEETCALVIAVDGHGSTTPAVGSHIYPCSADVNLTATPNESCAFSHWSGALSGSANPATIHMDSDKNVTAHFSEISYTLTVRSDGCCSITVGELGTVAPNSTEEFNIACGAEVTLEAVAGEGCDFDGWKVDGSSVEGNPITVTIDSNHSVTATCTESGHCTLTVSIAPEGTGTVSLNPTQPGEGYACGTDVELIAIPNESYVFSHWSGALSGSANPATIHMDSDKNATAHFSKAQEMHIAGIEVALKTGGFWFWKYTYATAMVLIIDAENSPVEGAQISGHWSGATNDNDSGTIDSSGKVTFASNHMQRAPEGTTFSFTADNASKSGWTYNAEANVETSDSITVNSSGSGLSLSSVLLLVREFIQGKIASLFGAIGCQEM